PWLQGDVGIDRVGLPHGPRGAVRRRAPLDATRSSRGVRRATTCCRRTLPARLAALARDDPRAGPPDDPRPTGPGPHTETLDRLRSTRALPGPRTAGTRPHPRRADDAASGLVRARGSCRARGPSLVVPQTAGPALHDLRQARCGPAVSARLPRRRSLG